MKKILVIDDDIQLNEMICEILTFEGYEIKSAPNGMEGLKLFIKDRPDLVITDIYMPEKEGLETIMEIRQADKAIKILVISGGCPHLNMSELFAMSEMFGADAVLPKPFAIETLLGKIEALLVGA